MKVAPSILTADFRNLEKEIRLIDSAADYIHLDIMDGTFVPNLSFGFPVVDAVSKVASCPLDAHLMVVNPQKWFEKFASYGVQMLSFHLEAAGWKSGRYLRQIKKLGMKAGIAVDPDVPVKKLFPYIGKADFFLIMSVFAGFGGQKFIYETIDRVHELQDEIKRRGADCLIQVDGGVGPSNIQALKQAGVDIVVAGSSVIGAEDPVAVIRELQAA